MPAETTGHRLLIMGGGGFVGGNLSTLALRRGWEVHIADATRREGVPGAAWHVRELTDGPALRELLLRLRPDAVVDLAAVADIDRAERERDLAWAVNVEAARMMAAACAELSASCLYFSSDAVFAGTAASYREEDAPGPVNWYGHTKVEGEKAVFAACPGAAVVRLSLVLGFSVTGAGNSFLAGLEAKLREGREVPSPANEVRTPIDVITLSECVLELLGLRFGGVLHIGATDSVDRYTLTRRAAELIAGRPDLVVSQESGAAAPGRAARHRNGIISVAKAQRVLATRLPSVEEALQRAVKERK
jgi:dTDP-4-dehydrorhamnose reductase